MQGFFSTIQMRILGALALLMAMITMGSYATYNFERVEFLNPIPASITVQGEGEMLAVPDVGQFSFSVNAAGTDASEAQELSGTKINEILSYLKEQGVEDKDVKTQNYNLYPKWRFEERTCLPGNSFCPPGEQVQDGFEVTQTVMVKVRDTDQSGAIIAGVGDRGATNISNLNFMVDDVEALKAEARAIAIIDARQKAALLAQQLGVQVVRLQYYFEGGDTHNHSHEDRFMAFDEMEAQSSFADARMPVGEESVNVEVTITYEVR